ncbi:hypothetical protein ABI59_05405 [Acidobacteria bacterium Mor1]|nr:hypothetical protein ABI59_05405 [Acidobacteria bacterium Mor1]
MSESARVLIVDDDAFIRRPLEFILKAEGFEPETAKDGEECLQKVKQIAPDLIFLDVMMPGRDGFSVCRELKADPDTADIPVIMLSAKGHEHDRTRGLELGAEDYMTKPYSPSELIRRVREILAED